MSTPEAAAPGTLDPADWDEFRRLSHRALDQMIDHIANVRTRPVWTEAPPDVRQRFTRPLPVAGQTLEQVLAEFERSIMPYSTGNLHPAFVGWVHGGGTPVGMVAEMLAGGLNANCGGRNHIGLHVEDQITRWMAEVFGFPATASGLFVTGTSMANFLGVLVARTRALGDGVRNAGLRAGPQLCAYTSAAAHGCIAQAMDMAGIGSAHLRRIAVDSRGQIMLPALAQALSDDRSAGLQPFLIVGTAGTVDIGAIDDLTALARLAAREALWFHVDGAFGALARLSPALAPLVAGIEQADSIAFDFHKWAQVPYDAGFLLVRDADQHRRTFASANGYLTRSEVGLAAGATWPCDLGPDLSRGFRALKTWFTIQVFGADRLGATMERFCALAKRLEHHVSASPVFDLVAPVQLNIVCLSARGPDSNIRNRKIVDHLHVMGSAAPSITMLNGRAVIRCAINNHRTDEDDIDVLIGALEDCHMNLFGPRSDAPD